MGLSLTYATYLRVEQLCDEKNISINKLCERAGVNQSTFSNYASDRTFNTSLVHIYIICDYLKITLSEFFDSPLFDKINIDLYNK